jgi:hypothetical protein
LLDGNQQQQQQPLPIVSSCSTAALSWKQLTSISPPFSVS